MPAQDIDQTRLFDYAVREGTIAFQAAIAKFNRERFYAFCFFTDGSEVLSATPQANTIEGFQRICQSDDPERRNHYKWESSEWDLDFGQWDDDRFMIETNNQMYLDYELSLKKEDDGTDREAFGKHKRQRLITLRNALLAIRESGVFKNHAIRDRLAFFVNVGDSPWGEIDVKSNPEIPHIEAEDLSELLLAYDGWQIPE